MKATRRIHALPSPLGTLMMVADAEGALLALDFPGANLRAADLDGLERELTEAGHAVERDPAPFARLLADLVRYFAGEPVHFDHVLAPPGTPFQHRVWQALTAIPHGETRTYAQLALAIGRPGAARAVGRANATNPIAIVVPCHRVIGADGALTGYAGGVERKRALLALERVGSATVVR